MPIYEFFCPPCHTVYKFFSRTVNTEKIPVCPRCGFEALHRQVSGFAIGGRHGEEMEDDDMPPMDEHRMEQAFAALAEEAEHMDEDDPKQAAGLMRKLSEKAGLEMGPAMEEALSRMERGEDPDDIEEELGEQLESEDPFLWKSRHRAAWKRQRPRHDDHLYDM